MMPLKHIQRELKAPKSQYNSFGKYNYRSCEDILEAVKPLLDKDDILTLSDEMVQVGDRYYVKATASLGEHSVTAYARESESKKGMDSAQVSGSTSSYARKYALNGLFLIDDAKDDDTRKPADVVQEAKEEFKGAGEVSDAYEAPPDEPEMTKKQWGAIKKSGLASGLQEDEIIALVKYTAERNGLNPKGRKVCDFLIGKNDKTGNWKMQDAIDVWNNEHGQQTEDYYKYQDNEPPQEPDGLPF
jgi:hypothetical protein